MTRLWAQDGGLAGARFDGIIDTDTDRNTGTIGLPVLSADDPDTAASELRTDLIVTGSVADANEGVFSLGSLLGSGTATDEGPQFVASAVETISNVRADVAALLALASPPSGLEGTGGILDRQWDKLELALDTVFNTDSDAGTGATSAVRMNAPRKEDILDDIDDILDALASEDAFVAATAADGGGVFESQGLGSSAAMDTFNRVKWSATATMGATGATRYGTAFRKATANARTGLTKEEVGAFSYSTMANTVRTSQAAAVSLTGIASYTGGTEAISAGGTTYSGTMDLQVRFAAETVSGVVKDLLDADGLPWQHNFADVEKIVLGDAKLLRNATFTSGTKTDGTVFFTADSGVLRPIDGLTTTLTGILLGTGNDAGSQANGVWEVGTQTSANYLTGGFGVMHVGDATRPRPGGDTGGVSSASLTSTAVASGVTTPTVALGDGKLTVKVQKYGWLSADHDNNTSTADTVEYVGLTGDDGNATLVSADFDLETLAGKAIGAKTTVNGPKHVDSVRATLQAQRDQIATLQALGSRTATTKAAEEAAWQVVQDAVQYNLFGGVGRSYKISWLVHHGSNIDPTDSTHTHDDVFIELDVGTGFSQLPVKLAGAYDEDDALSLIDRAIDALSNTTALFAALDPDGTGIFDHYGWDWSNAKTYERGDGTTTPTRTDLGTTGLMTPDTSGSPGGSSPVPFKDNNGNPIADATGNMLATLYDSTNSVYITQDSGEYIYFDTTDRRYETRSRNRTLGNFLGEREHQVIASLGTTDYTRFGIWYRFGTESAEREPSNQRGNATAPDGGPGAFAYSPLDPTTAGASTNPAFPIGGSASYVGEVVAHMHTDVLTGEARVDVSWASATEIDFDTSTTAGSGNPLTTADATYAGSMSLTLAGLADADGDPLTYTGISGGPAEGYEIAEIVFSDMDITVGLAGGRSGQLVVGTPTVDPNDSTKYIYGESAFTISSDTNNPPTLENSAVRYRLAAIGMDDQPPAVGATASVGSLFVGQGVDGPLGVIGTFTLDDTNVARVHAQGNKLDDAANAAGTNTYVYGIQGAFGADSP